MNGNTSEYCFISGQQNISTTGMVILVSIAPCMDRTSVQPNGNTSEYCSISGQNISTTVMVILVSTASLEDRTSV